MTSRSFVPFRLLCCVLRLLLPVGAALDVASVAAEPPGPLMLEAPPDARCLDADTLSARVRARLGLEQGRSLPALHVVITRRGGGFAATIVASSDPTASGLRTLESDDTDCHALDDALVMVLVTVVGFGEGPAREPRPEPAAEPPHAPIVPAPAPVSPARKLSFSLPDSPAPARSRHYGLSSLVSTGLAPSVALGAELSALLKQGGRAWSLGARALVAPGYALDADTTVRFSAWLARAAFCGAVLDTGTTSLWLCPGLRAGLVVTQSRGAARDLRTRAELVEAELGARLVVQPRAARFGIAAGLSCGLPLWAPAFAARDERAELNRYHRVNPGVSVEIGVLFGGRS